MTRIDPDQVADQIEAALERGEIDEDEAREAWFAARDEALDAAAAEWQ